MEHNNDIQLANNEIMNQSEVADYLNVSRTTIWHLQKKFKIPFMMVGGRPKFPKSAIDKWISDSTISAKR